MLSICAAAACSGLPTVSGADRTAGYVQQMDLRGVTVTPAANQTGTATIIVTVSDGSLTAPANFILTVTPNFSSWISAYPGVGGLSGAGDDPDRDGRVNLLEYGLGTNPAAASTAPAAQIVQIVGSAYLQIQWTRPNDRGDITTLGRSLRTSRLARGLRTLRR